MSRSTHAREVQRAARRRSLAVVRNDGGNRHGARTRCVCCGALNDPGLVCCPLAPEPSDWCAWCGADAEPDVGPIGRYGRVGNRRVFCDPRCSTSYHQDLASSLRQTTGSGRRA